MSYVKKVSVTSKNANGRKFFEERFKLLTTNTYNTNYKAICAALDRDGIILHNLTQERMMNMMLRDGSLFDNTFHFLYHTPALEQMAVFRHFSAGKPKYDAPDNVSFGFHIRPRDFVIFYVCAIVLREEKWNQLYAAWEAILGRVKRQVVEEVETHCAENPESRPAVDMQWMHNSSIVHEAKQRAFPEFQRLILETIDTSTEEALKAFESDAGFVATVILEAARAAQAVPR